jgi:hypothetical protein
MAARRRRRRRRRRMRNFPVDVVPVGVQYREAF